jgi:hypothetical protein
MELRRYYHLLDVYKRKQLWNYMRAYFKHTLTKICYIMCSKKERRYFKKLLTNEQFQCISWITSSIKLSNIILKHKDTMFILDKLCMDRQDTRYWFQSTLRRDIDIHLYIFNHCDTRGLSNDNAFVRMNAVMPFEARIV